MKLILTLALASLPIACSAKTPPAPPAQEAPVTTDCTTTLKPGSGDALRDAIEAAPKGAVLCVQPSRVVATLGFSRNITLRGVGDSPADVVIDADQEGPVLHVREDGIEVTLENLTLRGGLYDSGGALSLRSASSVTLRSCIVADNEAEEVGGGAFYVHSGRLSLTDCTLEENRAPMGGALLLSGDGNVSMSGGTIRGNKAERGGAAAMRHGGTLSLQGVAFAGNEATDSGGAAIYLKGSDRGTPTLSVQGSELPGGKGAIVDDGGLSTVSIQP